MLTARTELRRRIEPLRRAPFLADCTSRQLARIDRLGTPIRVDAGRELTREGDIGRECFVTIEGVAVVRRDGMRIATIGAGSIVGEIALLDRRPRNATVVAGTAMRLVALTPREFGELLELAPGVEPMVRRLADERRMASESFATLSRAASA